MFPADFVQRIGGQNYLDSGSLLKALEEPSPVSIRRNTERWSKVPFDSEPVPWSSGGFWLAERPSFTLDPLFHAGCYYPQEASGMFLEQVVKQTIHSLDNVKVLDLCAAPGGKSLILSDMIGPGGLLVANEVIRQRASVLAETITKWGNDNTLVTQSDPGAFGKLPGFFDIILCDAPCSGEGMFRTEIAVKEWSKTNTDHCSERQKRILMDVWPSLKENGMLIYSTCTFNPGENEENIKWLTEKHDAESISLDISQFEGITEIEYKGIVGYGFHPGKVRGEGLFVSVIRKKEGESFKPQKTSRMSDFRASKSEKETAIRWTNFNSDNLLKTGEDLFALPCDR